MKKNLLIIVLLSLFSLKAREATPLYFCTAATNAYFAPLLNLLGSICAYNYDDLGEIAVFDLGLSSEQKNYLETLNKVKVYSINKTNDFMLDYFLLANGYIKLGSYSWKPVAIKQALDMFPYVLWLDAGTTVLKPLRDLFNFIVTQGYFLGTIGSDQIKNIPDHPLSSCIVKKVYDHFDLSKPENNYILVQDSVMANTVGVCRGYEDVFLNEWYALSKHIEYFEDDGSSPNGPGGGRHDQALLGIIAHKNNALVMYQDYRSLEPMKFFNFDGEKDFYITWRPCCVNEKTHIYSSRGDLRRYDYFVSYLRKK